MMHLAKILKKKERNKGVTNSDKNEINKGLEWAKKSEGPHRVPPEISINPKSQLLIFFPL